MSDYESSPAREYEDGERHYYADRDVSVRKLPAMDVEAKTNGNNTSLHRSRSLSRNKRYSRSRSRSPHYKRKRSRVSRSRSKSRGRRVYDDYDESYRRSYSRSPMPPRRRGNYGDRDAPQPNRCIGVFGLSLYTTEKNLRDEFDRYGAIENVQIVYDRQTGRSRGFGFVYFKNTDDAYEAKDRCNGIELDGRKIRVDFSLTERPHAPTPGIYLGRTYDSGGYSRRSPRGRYTSRYDRRSPVSPSYTYGYRRSYSRSPHRKYY